MHRRPALPVGAGVISGVRGAIEHERIGEAVFDTGIAVEVPVGFHAVHFFPEGHHLVALDQGIGIAVADKDAGLDRLRCGQRRLEQAVEAHNCREVLPVTGHFQHREAAEAEADREVRQVRLQFAQ